MARGLRIISIRMISTFRITPAPSSYRMAVRFDSLSPFHSFHPVRRVGGVSVWLVWFVDRVSSPASDMNVGTEWDHYTRWSYTAFSSDISVFIRIIILCYVVKNYVRLPRNKLVIKIYVMENIYHYEITPNCGALLPRPKTMTNIMWGEMFNHLIWKTPDQ